MSKGTNTQSDQTETDESIGLIIRGRISQIDHVIRVLHRERKRLIKKCKHTHTQRFERQIAEDDPWEQCMDCGEEVI